MTPLISAHSLSKSYGTITLFKSVSFTISNGDRIGMFGPNGAGKSSLIKILAGMETPDEGHISKKQNIRIGYSSQTSQIPEMTVEQFLVSQRPKNEEAQAVILARILLGKAEFTDFNMNASLLSGGWKKRLDILKALMNEPEILLLDEPTNHLDLEGILWLEKFLQKVSISYLIISHDRYFLDNVTNKIIEINKCYPEGLLQNPGNMTAFLERKIAFQEAQEKLEKGLSYKVREEIDWLRTSPKARTTKSQSRIKQAHKLIDELSEVKQRNKVNQVEIDFSASERETRKLLVAKNVCKSFGDKQLFKNIELTLGPGTRVGIVGKNGTGKTTLLKILSGSIPQDSGTIKYADDLRIVYFDQQREQIPPNISLREAFSPNSDIVNYRGQQIHVNGWAKKFLFSPDRLNLPVGYLSGGEKARILIAKLMLEPADILFLDEPTNDLDIATLEIMEESFTTFEGAIVLISHDRYMMGRLCTKIVGLGENQEHQQFASYSQWEQSQNSLPKKEKAQKLTPNAPPQQKQEKGIKLTYKEKKELESIESLILEAEEKIESLNNELKINSNSLENYKLLGDIQNKLDALYSRWQVLLDKEKEK